MNPWQNPFEWSTFSACEHIRRELTEFAQKNRRTPFADSVHDVLDRLLVARAVQRTNWDGTPHYLCLEECL